MGNIDDGIILEAYGTDRKKLSAIRKRKRIISLVAAIITVMLLTGAVYAADVIVRKGKSVFQTARDEGVPYESLDEYQDIKYSEVGGNAADQKTEIYEKMLNSIDYYTNLEVTLETNMPEEEPVTVECQTDIPDSLAYEALYRNGKLVQEYIVNRNTSARFDHETGETYFDTGKVYSMATSPKIPLEERITVMEDGLPCYERRGNATNCTYAPYSMFPQDIAYSFLKNFDRWEITGSEEILGRKCAVISGTPAPYKSAQYGIDAFTLYVDSETGVLMKLNGTSGGETEKYILVTECDYGSRIEDNADYKLLLEKVEKNNTSILENDRAPQGYAVGGTGGCLVHDNSYHGYLAEFIDYVGRDRFEKWYEETSGDYNYSETDCPCKSSNIYEFVHYFNFPKEEFIRVYNGNYGYYYSNGWDIDLLYEGTAEENDGYYRKKRTDPDNYRKRNFDSLKTYIYTKRFGELTEAAGSAPGSLNDLSLIGMIYLLDMPRKELEGLISESVDGFVGDMRSLYGYDIDAVYNERKNN